MAQKDNSKTRNYLWLSIACIGLCVLGGYYIDHGYERYLDACHLPHLYFVPYIPYVLICLLALGALFCSIQVIRLCCAPNAGVYSRLAMILGLVCVVMGAIFSAVGLGMEGAAQDVWQQEREYEYQQMLERSYYERLMEQSEDYD